MKNTVSYINDAIKKDAKEFVLRCDAAYHNKLDGLARTIKNNKAIKIIMIAGPSGSGKTTTSHLFCDALKKQGILAQIISLDNFYLNREQLPLNEEGIPDVETVYSLDLPLIDACLSRLISEGRCEVPIFDFNTASRAKDVLDIELGDNGLLIVEGLHALNPLLYGKLPQEAIFKLYISVASSVYTNDGRELLSGEQMRFCRRMTRDSIYRNSTPSNTIKMWRDVVEGEKRWIAPFKDKADAQIDTFHAYENCLFSRRSSRMLRDLSKGLYDSVYADRIADALEQFCELDIDIVPQDSLLREFIEGGKYEDVT
ncbi:MAG: nucleoside kinase [Clostridia bacterium]|nr:nucleoside kinase [Clostridia bacterium]